MVVCKYFLNDSCRFGSRCRFEHVRDTAPNPYVYNAKHKTGISVLQRGDSALPANPTVEQFHNSHRYNTYSSPPQSPKDEVQMYLPMMMKEAAGVESENHWKLTCMGFLVGHGNIPGWVDYSPEELRWEAYKCQAEGNFNKYVMEYTTLMNKSKEMRSIFLRPTKVGESIIRDYLQNTHLQETQGSSHSAISQPLFNSAFQTDPINSFSFAMAVQNDQPQLTQPSSYNTFSFASVPSLQTQQNMAAPSAFGGSVVSPPIENIFGQVPPMNSVQAQTFAFSSPMSQGSFFDSKSNMFGNYNTGIESNAAFDRPFGKTPATSENEEIEKKLYTKIELLTKEELEQFQADTFTLGKIPTRPPPKEFCIN